MRNLWLFLLLLPLAAVAQSIEQKTPTLAAGSVPISSLANVTANTVLCDSGAYFTGTTSTTTLTVVNLYSGTIAIGQTVTGANVTANTKITGGSGTTWTITPSQTSFGPMWSGVPGSVAACTNPPQATLWGASNFGTDLHFTNGYFPQLIEITAGTSGAPVTGYGALVKMSKTSGIPTGVCVNQYDSECDSVLDVESVATAADVVQNIAGFFGAKNPNNLQTTGVGALGIFTQAEGTGTGSSAEGAYITGQRDSTTGYAFGAEVRAINNSGSNCVVSYSTASLNTCVGLWLANGGSAADTGSALQTAPAPSFPWLEGITLSNSSVLNNGFNDQSSSTTAFLAGSGHTNAFSSPGFTVGGTGATNIAGLFTLNIGQSGGSMNIGGDVNTTGSRSANTRKLARIVVPTYDNTSTPVAMIASDNDGTNNNLNIGGTVGTSGMTAATQINLLTATALNTNGGTVAQSIGPAGLISFPLISSDATHTDTSVCQDTTSHALYSGSGTVGICLGTSSARYKHDISPLFAGLGEVMLLKPIRYKLNADHGDPNKQLYGFAAEDMKPVLPDLVGLDQDGKPNTADYIGLIPVLVKALQDQQHEIEALRAQLAKH
jgi:Chaperone of endosialidase